MGRMVGNFASLLVGESLISLNLTDENLLPNQTFDLYYQKENMTSVGSGLERGLVEVSQLLNSSEKDLLDCGTMPDIARVKVCFYFYLFLWPVVINQR